MAWVYILQCRDGSFYVGSTRTLERRLFEHQQGLGAEYTKRRLPVRLVWSAEFCNVGAAFAAEKQIQGWSRAKRLALIEGRFSDLPGLSRSGGSVVSTGSTDGDGGSTDGDGGSTDGAVVSTGSTDGAVVSTSSTDGDLA